MTPLSPHWYNLLLIGLASAIIYPDQVLLWIGQQTGRVFAVWTLIVVPLVAVPMMAIAMKMLMTFHYDLDWWDMLIYIGVVGLARIIFWVGGTLFRWLFDI